MADGSVTTKLVQQPDYIYDDVPYERIVARLNGIEALNVVAQCAMDSPTGGAPTAKVWLPLWHFLGMVTQDIHRDLCEMQQQARGRP